MEQYGCWDIYVLDDGPSVREDGWLSWGDELPMATARAATRARQEEAAAGSSTSGVARVRSDGAAARVLMVDDPDALDCTVCYLPLMPPIFQCKVGHVVCSLCCDKLRARGKCHVCGISEGGYSRCHAMERLVECIRVQCPNAAYGCTTKLAYYDQRNHCHCPGEACSFIGSTAALLDHISCIHGWHCSTKIKIGDACSVYLRDGFNFLLAYRDTNGTEGVTATPAARNQWLFLVNVARRPLDRVSSMLCIHPHANTGVEAMLCSLEYSGRSEDINNYDGQFFNHYQRSSFGVACTDLSNGLPNLDKCFRFVVPNSVEQWEYTMNVNARIAIM